MASEDEGGMKGRELFRKKKVPQPSLIREDRMARTLAAEYEALFKKLRIKATISPYAVLHQLQDLMGERGVDVERFRTRLNAQFVGETRRALTDLLENGPEELRFALQGRSFAIPAREAFGQRLSMIRELYLDDAVARIEGEEDLLKRSFLKKLTTWAEKGGELDVQGLVERMRTTANGRAGFSLGISFPVSIGLSWWPATNRQRRHTWKSFPQTTPESGQRIVNGIIKSLR